MPPKRATPAHLRALALLAAISVLPLLLWWSWLGAGEEGARDWDAMARSLGAPALADVEAWRHAFEATWRDVIGAAGLAASMQAQTHLFYPMSGGDVGTLFAINPRAAGYVMASNMPAFATGGWAARDRWLSNRTRLQAASLQAREIIRLSHAGGYQYGHMLRRFAAEHGVIMLLLAVQGALRSSTVELVQPIESDSEGLSGVELNCRRSVAGDRFWIRYVDVDVRDPLQLASLERVLRTKWAAGARVLTVLKGAESALQLRDEHPDAFRLLYPDRVPAAQQEAVEHNLVARRIAASFLRMSDVVVQDVTGANK
jgi:hypothetical protein